MPACPGLQWVVDAYTLALATTVLTAGALADRLGRRRLFAVGLVVFTLSSLAAAMAGTIEMLNTARAVQGVGGAILFAVSLALLAHAYPGKRERAGRARRLRRDDRRFVRRRAARRRPADVGHRLAVGLPDQHPDRDLRAVDHVRRRSRSRATRTRAASTGRARSR